MKTNDKKTKRAAHSSCTLLYKSVKRSWRWYKTLVKGMHKVWLILEPFFILIKERLDFKISYNVTMQFPPKDLFKHKVFIHGIKHKRLLLKCLPNSVLSNGSRCAHIAVLSPWSFTQPWLAWTGAAGIYSPVAAQYLRDTRVCWHNSSSRALYLALRPRLLIYARFNNAETRHNYTRWTTSARLAATIPTRLTQFSFRYLSTRREKTRVKYSRCHFSTNNSVTSRPAYFRPGFILTKREYIKSFFQLGEQILRDDILFMAPLPLRREPKAKCTAI